MSKILAVLEQRDGTLRKVSFEVVTAAGRLGPAVEVRPRATWALASAGAG